MFNKFKKSKELATFFQEGLQIKIKETRNGRKVSVRPNDYNRVIDISIKGDSIEYNIIDAHKGSMKFCIPKNTHREIFDEYLEENIKKNFRTKKP
ncbi:hypothetical protein GPDM_00995 [Planococcus donghaensis MPA1U2]|uniref:Uncharacterized protein n=1 Tax=Planococcus donghaensis MPA1U2 TaxID=933115 RepID=E7RCN5_9BACL|nr:hypothetical protein [Planococcus donghaensis]EGA91400.1 hypothetical protein GPDM_00995 [Planococcus donghaensis MPA1U2]